MNIFCRADGTIFHVDTEPIYQGSVGVNKIRFIGQFPKSAQVLMSYTLPNGNTTHPKLMTAVADVAEVNAPDGGKFSVWESYIGASPKTDDNGNILKSDDGQVLYDLDYTITEYYGKLEVQFYVYGAARAVVVDGVTQNTGFGRLATATCVVDIQKGNAAIPYDFTEHLDDSTKLLERILGVLSDVGTRVSAVESDVISANNKANLNADEIRAVEGLIPKNIEDGSGVGAVQQVADKVKDGFDFTGKNPNAENIDPSLSGVQPYGAVKDYSHAEGGKSSAQGKRSHAEGTTTIAKGSYSHAEGENVVSIGNSSHAEGMQTVSKGYAAHAENAITAAIGDASHAEGYMTTAEGDYSHAGGIGTIAMSTAQMAIGKHNKRRSDALLVVGNGASDAERSDIFAVLYNCAEVYEYNLDNPNSIPNVEGAREIVQQLFVNAGLKTDELGNVVQRSASCTGGEANAAFNQGEVEGTLAFAANISQAKGYGSAAFGANTEAVGDYSFAQGIGTIATGDGQAVFGKYNLRDIDALFIIGNGDASNSKNAVKVLNDNRMQVYGAPLELYDVARLHELKEVETIAKGAVGSVSFTNYAELVSTLLSAPNGKYHVGQHLLIRTLNAPDLWVFEEADWRYYNYVDDETFVENLNDGVVWIGNYKLSPLETQKVNLDDYYTKDETDSYFLAKKTGITQLNQAYVKTTAGNNEMFGIDTGVSANTLVRRDNNGDIIVGSNPSKGEGAVNKNYVSNNFLAKPSATVNSIITYIDTCGVETKPYTNKIPYEAQFCSCAGPQDGTNEPVGTGYYISKNPINPYHLTTKKYVDDLVASAGGGGGGGGGGTQLYRHVFRWEDEDTGAIYEFCIVSNVDTEYEFKWDYIGTFDRMIKDAINIILYTEDTRYDYYAVTRAYGYGESEDERIINLVFYYFDGVTPCKMEIYNLMAQLDFSYTVEKI